MIYIEKIRCHLLHLYQLLVSFVLFTMTNGFLKKGGQTAEDLAKKAAQRVAHEEKEFLKSAKTQVGLEVPQQSQGQSLVDEIITSGGVKEASPQEKAQIERQKTLRLQRLEEDLRLLRGERAKEYGQWKEAQGEALKPREEPQQETFVPPPSSRPKRGAGPGQKNKGSWEMLTPKK